MHVLVCAHECECLPVCVIYIYSCCPCCLCVCVCYDPVGLNMYSCPCLCFVCFTGGLCGLLCVSVFAKTLSCPDSVSVCVYVFAHLCAFVPVCVCVCVYVRMCVCVRSGERRVVTECRSV